MHTKLAMMQNACMVQRSYIVFHKFCFHWYIYIITTEIKINIKQLMLRGFMIILVP